jgi:hypothetical protein
VLRKEQIKEENLQMRKEKRSTKQWFCLRPDLKI